MEEIEIWKDVVGFEGLYKISNYGVVKSNRIEALKQHESKKGYMRVTLCKNGKPKLVPVHRIVCIAFNPNPFKLPQVNHIKGNKKDNRAWMLEWCTGKYNIQHAFQSGLCQSNGGGPKGSKNGKTILKDEQVLEIANSKNVNRNVLAKKFGVKPDTINQITRGARWSHLTGIQYIKRIHKKTDNPCLTY